jgi:hypothetical protein
MARLSTGAHIVKQPAFFLNKTRLLLYGSASLALFIIHLWTRTGFLARSIILSSPDALRGRSPRRARSFLDVHHAASPEVILDTLASAGEPTECCGDVTSSCGLIPASKHLLVFVSIPNVASGTARRWPLRKQWHKSLALMEQRMRRTDAGIAGGASSSSTSSSSSSSSSATSHPTPPLPRTALRFVIGTENMEQTQLDRIKQEATTHKDILLIDAPDEDHGEPKHRSATTLKVMHSMRFAANNFLFEYFARVGDDAYFRVDFFAELVLLQKVYPQKNAYVGYKFANHVVPASDSTHSFIVGMGFFLSRDLATYVCKSYPFLLDGFPEDAIVGSWFVGTNARVIHEPRFHDIDHITTVAYARCSNESLLLHHMWHQDNWDAIDEKGLLKC